MEFAIEQVYDFKPLYCITVSGFSLQGLGLPEEDNAVLERYAEQDRSRWKRDHGGSMAGVCRQSVF